MKWVNEIEKSFEPCDLNSVHAKDIRDLIAAVRVMKDALEAIVDTNEDWSLEQERLGNRALVAYALQEVEKIREKAND